MHASAQPSPWHDVPYRPPARGVTRVHIHLGGGIIRPVSPDRTHVSMVVNVDPKLAYIPSALQNFVAKHLAAWGFQLFRHQAKKLKGDQEHVCVLCRSCNGVHIDGDVCFLHVSLLTVYR